MISNIFAGVFGLGALCLIGCMGSAIASQNKYEDAAAEFLFVVAFVLLFIGGVGLLIARFA